MDNSELHYLTYDPDEIWNTMILNYVEAGGDILYPGDEKEILLRSVLADIVQVFAGADNALRMATLRYAVGGYLDVLGELRGCSRIEASAARARVTVTTNETGKTDVLEAGSSMTADGQVFYLLVDDLPLTGYQQTVTVDVVADRAGNAGNGLAKGTEMSLSFVNSGVRSIIVSEDATGGNEREEDEAYRNRIREYGLASITTGPQQQYEAVAKSTSSQVIDARALNLGPGKVGVYLILASDEGKDAVLKAVLDAMSADSVRPLTDDVSVYQAGDITYKLEVQYTPDNVNTSTAAITQAVKEYQEWQDNTIGRPFNPDRLIAAVYQAGAVRVTFGPESVFNGKNDIKYTEIGETERCKGTVVLSSTMM